ncbi:MAG: PBP1A family penicillin-binding protein [Lachnospiraceae bacterium]|nr:PBP1A family penicillin-binding protein [Lachnospiraceae bacterium]
MDNNSGNRPKNKINFDDYDINKDREDEIADEISRNLKRAYSGNSAKKSTSGNGQAGNGANKGSASRQGKNAAGRNADKNKVNGRRYSESYMKNHPEVAASIKDGTNKKKKASNADKTAKKAAKKDAKKKPSAMAKGSKKDKKKKKHKKFWFIFRIVILAILLIILIASIVFYLKYGKTIAKWKKDAKETVQASSKDTFKNGLTSVIYTSNGKQMAELKGDRQTYYLKFSDIPDNVKEAFIQTEDRDYYKHKGYDIEAIASATVQYVNSKIFKKKIARGGSTITQQLAKLVFLTNEQSLERKTKEIFISMELEKKYSKDDILEFYVNNIYFANGYYGIEAAAEGYFSKTTAELDLAETAFLCSIPNSPSRYNPLQHFDNTIERKNRILKEMYEQKVISKDDYEKAKSEAIVMKPKVTKNAENTLTSFVVTCATKAIMMKKGFKFKYKFKNSEEKTEYKKDYEEVYNACNKEIYSKGYHIYTSINKKKQKKLQKSVNEQLKLFKDKTDEKLYKVQGAATCIDNTNGRIVAIVGGRKQKHVSSFLNRAYQSPRQPGSSFKPIAVYAPILERGYTPNSTVNDTYFEGGPRNSNGVYAGSIPLRTAVEQSKNVVAWRLFEELTPKVGLNYIYKMGFNYLSSRDNVPAASLGGLTTGATTVEMASAYACLQNDGVFRTPTCIVKITDSEGSIVVDKKDTVAKKRVYKKDAARMMTDILTGVLIRGTAAGKGLTNMPSAGKTGTTSDKKDGWFCGYTPYYTTAVWVGCDKPEALYGLTGASYPLNIWRQFMSDIHIGLETKEFDLELTDTEGYTPSDNQSQTIATATPSGSSSATPSTSASPKATKGTTDASPSASAEAPAATTTNPEPEVKESTAPKTNDDDDTQVSEEDA